MAAKQHGVLSIGQLYRAGLTPSGVARRVKAGRLHPVHRGVYAVGHAGLTRQGMWLAAVRAGEQLGLSPDLTPHDTPGTGLANFSTAC